MLEIKYYIFCGPKLSA